MNFEERLKRAGLVDGKDGCRYFPGGLTPKNGVEIIGNMYDDHKLITIVRYSNQPCDQLYPNTVQKLNG